MARPSRLREADEGLSEALLAALREAVTGDPTALVASAHGELERAGGPCDDGYLRHA